MMFPVEPHFSRSYKEAREKFLSAANAAELQVHSFEHPERGRDGETLAMDIARSGAMDAANLLIVSSACHGVEGFCGSGIQSYMLHDASWQRFAQESGVAVLYVHGLNPYGFSWWRRTTHENVDLNRNFVDFDLPLPHNDAYDEIASLLVPGTWPPEQKVIDEIARYVATHGHAAYQAAASGGQYRHPDGIFYGGHEPTWSNINVRQFLRTHASRASQLAWIDVHTGLGPSGIGEKIFGCRRDASAIARAREWWGEEVTQLDDGTSASAPLKGLLWHAPYDECPQAEYTCIGLEFGTVKIDRMIDALRADQWLQSASDCSDEQRVAVKRETRDAFYTDEKVWKEQVVEQAMTASTNAILGMVRQDAERTAR